MLALGKAEVPRAFVEQLAGRMALLAVAFAIAVDEQALPALGAVREIAFPLARFLALDEAAFFAGLVVDLPLAAFAFALRDARIGALAVLHLERAPLAAFGEPLGPRAVGEAVDHRTRRLLLALGAVERPLALAHVRDVAAFLDLRRVLGPHGPRAVLLAGLVVTALEDLTVVCPVLVQPVAQAVLHLDAFGERARRIRLRLDLGVRGRRHQHEDERGLHGSRIPFTT